MKKITVLSMISIDGVMQAPGGPEEDPFHDFKYGGWVAPYGDEFYDAAMQKVMEPSDLLLGRTTFEIWEHYWPAHASGWPGINEVNKYVFSSGRQSSDWSNSVFLSSLEDLEALKQSEGTDIQVWGSSKLVQLLLANDLVDELVLLIHPLMLGKGKKLFDDSANPRAFTLAESTITPSGVIVARYLRAGAVKTGTVGD
jgi:dihydrofolate reductase